MRRPSRRSGERGQATLEFFLIFPIFFVLFLLVIEFGVWMFESVTIANAVREAARYGSVTCSGDSPCNVQEILDRAIARSNGILTGGDDFKVGWRDRTGNTDWHNKHDSIVVKVKHDYKLIFFPNQFVGGIFKLPVVACADMRLETDNTTAPEEGPEDC